ncbi:MAG: hypothetical protein RLZZ175_80 [Bacteroidota bacterium]|jgi:hypothetical protein
MKKIFTILLTIISIDLFAQVFANDTCIGAISIQNPTTSFQTFTADFSKAKIKTIKLTYQTYEHSTVYYKFISTANVMLFKFNEDLDSDLSFYVRKSNNCNLTVDKQTKDILTFNKTTGKSDLLLISNLEIGNEYVIVLNRNSPGTFNVPTKLDPLKVLKQIQYRNVDVKIINDIPSGNVLLNYDIPSSFNLIDLLSSQQYMFRSNCLSTLKDSNVVDIYYRFTPTSSTANFKISLKDPSLYSSMVLIWETGSSYDDIKGTTCQGNQANKTERIYTFNNLTANSTTIIRLAIGSLTSKLGYERIAISSSDVSVTLMSNSVTNIEENSIANISIYPNPSSNGYFQVISDDEIQQIKVTNTLGESELFENTKQISTKLKGLLLVELISNKGKFIQKLIVE